MYNGCQFRCFFVSTAISMLIFSFVALLGEGKRMKTYYIVWWNLNIQFLKLGTTLHILAVGLLSFANLLFFYQLIFSFVAQLLGEKYAALRRTRGDGNCFFRSFMFSYLVLSVWKNSFILSQDKEYFSTKACFFSQKEMVKHSCLIFSF
jgi:Peptidase C65 Otubain